MTPTELYRHWDSEGRLLYVGISSCADRRLAQHIHKSPWRDLIANVTTEQHPTRGAAVDAEAKAILEERPIFNKAGKKPPIAQTFDTAAEMAKIERWLANKPSPRQA